MQGNSEHTVLQEEQLFVNFCQTASCSEPHIDTYALITNTRRYGCKGQLCHPWGLILGLWYIQRNVDHPIAVETDPYVELILPYLGYEAVETQHLQRPQLPRSYQLDQSPKQCIHMYLIHTAVVLPHELP